MIIEKFQAVLGGLLIAAFPWQVSASSEKMTYIESSVRLCAESDIRDPEHLAEEMVNLGWSVVEGRAYAPKGRLFGEYEALTSMGSGFMQYPFWEIVDRLVAGRVENWNGGRPDDYFPSVFVFERPENPNQFLMTNVTENGRRDCRFALDTIWSTDLFLWDFLLTTLEHADHQAIKVSNTASRDEDIVKSHTLILPKGAFMPLSRRDQIEARHGRIKIRTDVFTSAAMEDLDPKVTTRTAIEVSSFR